MVATGHARSPLSVVIPVLHDDEPLDALLTDLAAWPIHCLVVDGAASAATEQLVKNHGQSYLHAPPGRGAQIAAGCAAADTEWLWVLHADSSVNGDLCRAVLAVTSGPPAWGRCEVRIPGLALIAWFMNRRSRWTRICTGDQGMFFHRSLLDAAGGFPALPLMEDIELSACLKRAAGKTFTPLSETIGTSPRRWQRHGIVRTVLRMWWFRARYYFGADADTLYRAYYGTPP